MLSNILLVILLLSSVLFFLGIWIKKKHRYYDPGEISKFFIRLYALIICGALIVAIGYFIGWEKFGTPRVDIEKLRRLTHRGYYIQPDSQLIVTGKPGVEEGFWHKSLAEDEKITFKPVWNRGFADKWEITAAARNNCLRLDDVCVNLPDDRWLEPGDTLMISFKKSLDDSQDRYISIRWQKNRKSFLGIDLNKDEEFYYFNQGTVENGTFIPGYPRDILLNERSLSLNEGYSLYTIIRLYRDSTTLNIDMPRWWEISRHIKFIRKKKGDTVTPIGVLIEDSLFNENGQGDLTALKFFKLRKETNVFYPLNRIDTEFHRSDLSFEAKFFYGFGFENALDIRLANKTVVDTDDDKNPKFGNVVDIEFVNPTHWPLPDKFVDKDNNKKNFIITSSSQYIAMDGYIVDVGNTLHPFYAKAEFNKEKDSLSMKIQEGMATLNPGIDQTIRLGDYKSGILLALTECQTPIGYIGKLAALFIFVLTILFWFLIKKEEEFRMGLDMAWGLIWGLTLTLLTVRLIITYRAALLPPTDVSPLEMANIFRKSVTISFWALLIVPSVLLLVRLLSIRVPWATVNDKITKLLKSKAHRKTLFVFIIYTFFFLALITLSAVLGVNESLVLRISILLFLYAAIGIALFARKIADISEFGKRWLIMLIAPSIVLLFAVIIILMKDYGSLIYCIPLCLCLLIAVLLGIGRKTGVWVGIFFLVVITAILALLPYIIQMLPSDFQDRVVNPNLPDHIVYRLAGFTGTEEAKLLADASNENSEVNMNMLLRNSHQNWQMLLYASEGISRPGGWGYGCAPLSNQGMTYPTSMTDCVFSIFLLSEHGRYAGIFLALTYIFLGAAILYGGCSFPDEYKHRVIPLTAIGGYFTYNAVYMAAANLGLTIFTGQNIPLLGLHSISDLVQGAVLLAMVAFLLGNDIHAGSAIEHPPISVTLIVLIILSLLIVILGFVAVMDRLSNEIYRRDHNFDNALFQQMQNNLPGGENPNPIMLLKGSTLKPKEYGRLCAIEKLYIDEFNNRPDKYNSQGGLYYLETQYNTNRKQNENVVRINRSFFVLSSPFRENKLWEGKIFSSGMKQEPTIMALKYPFAVSLSNYEYAAVINLGFKKEPQTVHTNNRVIVTENNTAFLELSRSTTGANKSDVFIIPKSDRNWSVYVEGEKLKSELNIPRELIKYDLVVIESRQPKNEFRYNLMYLGLQSPALSSVQWRNGSKKRLFYVGDRFAMLYMLGKAADSAQKEKEIPPEITLTLDYDLHSDLHKSIARYADENPLYMKKEKLHETRRIAVTVMDTYTGKIFALPSWPPVDISDPEFEKKLENLAPRNRTKLLKNNNLKNHAVGSTIKPVIFATVAEGFYGKMDPAQIYIYHNKQPLNRTMRPDEKCPHPVMGKIPIGEWDCLQPNYSGSTAGDYLVNSRNYCEVFMGMLGLLLTKDDWDNIKIEDFNWPDMKYNDVDYALDFTGVLKSVVALNGKDCIPTSRMNDSILFKGLTKLFGTGVSEETGKLVYLKGETFLPFFFGTQRKNLKNITDNDLKSMGGNEYLDDLLPDAVNFMPKDGQTLRGGIISFCLGGGDCRWNNVHIMEALTGIATGLKMEATLEAGKENDSEAMAEPMPEPLNDPNWRYNNLVVPMEKVGEEGTAKALKDMVPSPYKIIYKTGTIEEGNEEWESELLFFIIGKWDEDQRDFIPGETVSCFFYLQDSKLMKDKEMKKFDFTKPIIIKLMNFLKGQEI
ncbi:MAG: hypothetical protein NT166_06290 [Candidatus Aminicenantes bacterium]|nr:hypothetical protein [Candidatus Aminicenantes bacterium]